MAPSFSAALLAGGRSTRMGRDKALLPVPGTDLLLWQRQLGVLEELRPQQILWSGPPRPGLPAHVRLVEDIVPEAGPLAGISACLDLIDTHLLVVLAIDLPQMTSAFLRDILAHCTAGCGLVVEHGHRYEPLAAVYPLGLRSLALDHLSGGRLALQELVRAGVERHLLRANPLNPDDASLFRNANSPEDWPVS